LKTWKKGVIGGAITGLMVISALATAGYDNIFVVALFYPDFLITGGIIGYLYGRFFPNKKN
jgi:hypothetical protein